MGVHRALLWIILAVLTIQLSFAGSLEIISPESKTYSTTKVLINLSYSGDEIVEYKYDDDRIEYEEPHYKIFSEGTHKLRVYVDNDFEESVSFTIKEQETIVLDESTDFVITIDEDGVQGLPDNPFTSYIWFEIPAYQESTMEVKKDVIGITKLKFTPRKDLGKVSIYVELLDGKPKGVERPSDNTYQFLKISKAGIKNTDFKEDIEIDFKVSEKWTVQNDADAEKIKLLHYNGSEWETLNTEYRKNDYDYYYYKAWSPSLSYFAIAEIEEEPVVEEVIEEEVEEVVEENIAEEPAVPIEEEIVDEEVEPEDNVSSSEYTESFTEITGNVIAETGTPSNSGKLYFLFLIAVTIVGLGMTSYMLRNEKTERIEPKQEPVQQAPVQQPASQKPALNPQEFEIPNEYLERLTSYIESRLSRGQSKEDIKRLLKIYGWDENTVERVMEYY